MNSPAKRRKKNDYTTSNPPRLISQFFAKQSQTQEVKEEANKIGDGVIEDKTLTDEELARKLQEEYNREYETLQHGENPAISNQDRPSIPEQRPNAAKIEEDIIDKPEATTIVSRLEGAKTLALQSSSDDEDKITANIPLDESPLTFDPSKYIPELQKHWHTDGGRATYALLTRSFILINATTSRIKIIDTMVNLLRTIIESDPSSLLPAVWLATNNISPPYIGLELGIGGSSISKALKKTCGLDNAGLKSLSSKYGDAGDVAFEAKKRQSFTLRKPKPLTIRSVYDSLLKIANAKGTGSQEVKQRIIERLILDTRGAEESRYIVRTLVQHLRIGAVGTSMLIALSRAFLLSRPVRSEFHIYSQEELRSLKKEQLTELYHQREEIVKACFARHPNYENIVPNLLEVGVCDELLLRCGLTMHIPLRPMLGSITRDLGEMLTKLQGRDFACEYKYDGQRAQVHCDDKGRVSIFSRHLEAMTDKYPDLVAIVPAIRGEGVSSFIIEGEVVAVDGETGELKTFQTLANRAKKDVAVGDITVQVCLYSFDLMYLNGESLLNRSFRERRSLLKSLFVEIPRRFTWVKSLDATSADSDTVLEFFNGAISAKCEGIMVKVLDNPVDSDTKSAPPTPSKPKSKPKAKSKTDISSSTETEPKPSSRRKALLSTYEPDKRLDSWLKVKKDYNSSADTLDLIPVAGWHGTGRKAKWWSPVLLAAYAPESGRLVAVTKCISGFSDAFYIDMRKRYDPAASIDDDSGEGEGVGNTLREKPSFVEYVGRPDVWFRPHEVWEIAFADITLSPTYTAGLDAVGGGRGLSTRFPRFLKIREDKGIEEASNEDFLAELFFKQMSKPSESGGAVAEEGEDEM